MRPANEAGAGAPEVPRGELTLPTALLAAMKAAAQRGRVEHTTVVAARRYSVNHRSTRGDAL